jgi:hypothetical protein
MSEATNINEMLAGRQARYGSFQGHAEISQHLKDAIRRLEKWDSLADDQGNHWT